VHIIRMCPCFQTYDHRRKVLSEISMVLSHHQYLEPVLERFGEQYDSVYFYGVFTKYL